MYIVLGRIVAHGSKSESQGCSKAKAAARGKAQAGCFLRALMDSKKLHCQTPNLRVVLGPAGGASPVISRSMLSSVVSAIQWRASRACCDIPGVVIGSILPVPSIAWPFARYVFDVLSSIKGTKVCGTCLATSI